MRLAHTDPTSATALVTYANFLQPATLYEVETRQGVATAMKSQASQFDSASHVAEQFEATSRDGTRVPYFFVHSKELTADARTPVLMRGYGAGIPQLPQYSGTLGRLWLEHGGAYVLANIRGGGEFGPAWYLPTFKEHRQRVYDDFYAVAQDLFERSFTSPRYLGIQGLSAGGMLMGVAITQRPELFEAAIIQTAPLDLLRYHKLLSGAFFTEEWGSPEVPSERAFLEQTSPYQNLRRRQDFPVPFIMTSTADDRVHPGHSRKFAAKMQALGLPFLYYESAEGGHFLATTPEQEALRDALVYTYLGRTLKNPTHVRRSR